MKGLALAVALVTTTSTAPPARGDRTVELLGELNATTSALEHAKVDLRLHKGLSEERLSRAQDCEEREKSALSLATSGVEIGQRALKEAPSDGDLLLVGGLGLAAGIGLVLGVLAAVSETRQ